MTRFPRHRENVCSTFSRARFAMRDDKEPSKTMSGADALVDVAIASGVEVCFANPGTSEMHLVGALSRRPEDVKSVLVLHENIASGAADGFARVRGRSGGRAMTLLHCYVGLANALSNSHNASRGRSPVVHVVGDTSTFHRGRGALLDNDVEALAKTVCEHGGIVRACGVPESIPMNVVDAFEASATRRAVSTLVVPHDASWSDVPMEAVRDAVARAEAMTNVSRAGAMTTRGGDVSESIRTFLRNLLRCVQSRAPGDECLFYVGGDATGEEELRLVQDIADALGADVTCECFFTAIERGGDLPRVSRAPYFPKDAVAAFDRYKVVCFVDVPKPPVAMFGYRDAPSTLFNQPDDDVWIIDAPPRMKIVDILRALRDEVAGGKRTASDVSRGVRDVVLDVLTRSAEDFDESASFWSQGMTSTKAVTLMEKLCREFDVKLNSTVVFDHNTLSSLAEHVAETLGVSMPSPSPPTKPTTKRAQHSSPKSPLNVSESPPDAALTAASACAVVAECQPADCVVVDESLTSGSTYWNVSASSPRFTHITLTGGSIGFALAASVGVAVAAPERQVVALVGDGSAHYAIQALWTQAREQLDVITVVMNNAKYQILELELAIQGVACASKTLTNLDDPRVDFVKVAEGYGVRAYRAKTTDAFRRAFSRALEEKGPTLIDAVLSNE